MKPRSRQRIALLLTAVLALLPVQGLMAALLQDAAPMDHAAMTAHVGHTMAKHAGHQAGGMPDCPIHQPGHGQFDGHHCNGGCDMCGACSGAMLPLPALTLTPAGDQPPGDTRIAQFSEPTYALYRPPRH